MSRCKEMRLKNRLPAFNLEVVQQHSEDVLNSPEAEVCSAALCHPMSAIGDRLFIGSWRDAADADLLAAHRITHVLNVARELPPHAARQRLASIAFVTRAFIPIDDSLEEELSQHFDAAFAFLREGTRCGRVLVHCRRGLSRSAAIVIAHLMATDGMTFGAALEFVRARRPGISLNLAFAQRLEEFGAHLADGSRGGRSGAAAEVPCAVKERVA